MRVVIDLPIGQLASSEDERRFLLFVSDLVSNGSEHELFVVLPAVDTSDSMLRQALLRLLPARRVHAWYPLSGDASARGLDQEIAKRIHAAAINRLRPDLVVRWFAESDSASGMPGIEGVPVVTTASAQKALDAINKAAENVASPVTELPAQRFHLAYFSPLPPVRSGIGDYSTELLPELSRYYDIDVIVDQEEVNEPRTTECCTIRAIEWFRQNAAIYDRVIYHIGNAEFHLYMLDCLAAHPGVVVLHDFFLSGAYGYQEFQAGVPYAWTRELYRSHGYAALAERFNEVRTEKVAFKYPVNFSVLRDATGIIVHSDYSRKLAATWYGEELADGWACVPHLRVPHDPLERVEARSRLGLAEDEFVICCFGVMGIAKQNQRLLDAWLLSDLGEARRCRLVFVGENGDDEYARNIVRTIRDRGVADRVHITGWASRETFLDYLDAADLAVQLRTYSRGETSGTVLDCMNHGVPTIVNACGTMADLPEDAVWVLPEEFEDSALIDAIETLWKNPDKRDALARNGKQAILRNHDPAHCARLYAEAIEASHRNGNQRELIDSLAALPQLPSDERALAYIATSVAQSVPAPRPARNLFIDVSVTSRTDLKTGIERVTRALMHEFIKSPPDGYRVEPVYLVEENGEWVYRYARKYVLESLDCPADVLADELIEMQAGDVFFCADLGADMVVKAANGGVYQRMKEMGVKVSFMVHDLLPLAMPEVFPPNAGRGFEAWLKEVVRVADVIVCVSRAVAEDVREWLMRTDVERNPYLELRWSHHGADIQASAPTRGLPAKARKTLGSIRGRRSFLVVGTIEPRKGYEQVLEAFNVLWQADVDVNLVIVGKEGWKDLPDDQRRNIPALMSKLRKHPERGRRLFWLENISDEYLDEVYAACDCLLAASLGEGFGLPLIEASSHCIPILARDIPVFREVAGRYAAYFSGNDASALATAIQEWLADNAHDTQLAGFIPFLNWRQSAGNLAGCLIPAAKVEERAGEVRQVGQLGLLPASNARRLYVDVSVVSREDFRTGVQRATRALLKQLVANPPDGFVLYPVRLAQHGEEWSLEFATNCFEAYFAEYEPFMPVPTGEIDTRPGDILLGLDLSGSMVVEAERQGLLEKIRRSGARTYFVVYDLLPVTAPQYFPESDALGHYAWLRAISRSDGVVCISNAVAEEFNKWYRQEHDERQRAPCVEWFHLGSDLESSLPTHGMPPEAETILRHLRERPTFLMVGTVEPRKGYRQVLQAFRKLWADGLDVNLVIVGKAGWNVDALLQEFDDEPELHKRFFWLNGISDEYLEALYAASTCLVAASLGEGFGLPLIEAAHHGLPLIVRDIPAFREVAGKSAFYFNGKEPSELEQAIRQWLDLRARGEVALPAGIKAMTWQESAEQLMNVILQQFAETELKCTEGNEQT